MENQNTDMVQGQEGNVEIDSWEAAFAALDKKNEEAAEKPAEPGAGEGAEGDSGSKDVPDSTVEGNEPAPQGKPGGLDPDDGNTAEENGNAFAGVQRFQEDELEKYKSDLDEKVRDQATREIAREFIKKGARHTEGVLGATIEDSDICRKDSDGVPHFFNPETGREFGGDNPRRAAQEWVDDYNKDLAKEFNRVCLQYEEYLKNDMAPALAVIEFAPKYDKLDPIRKGMFDNVIQDYEIKDDSNQVVGYSCDLDKALAMVERQVAMIQSYAKEHSQQQPQQPAQQQQPALDMKTSSGAIPSADDAPPQSLAEAMERQQDILLANLKKN